MSANVNHSQTPSLVAFGVLLLQTATHSMYSEAGVPPVLHLTLAVAGSPCAQRGGHQVRGLPGSWQCHSLCW